jgi:hypothetical protein
MNTSAAEIRVPSAVNATIDEDNLLVHLDDGRSISAPLAWYPRLFHATIKERENWRFIGKGHGLHWPDLDEDVSVENLLLGKPSTESQESLKKWLDARGE